MVLGEREGKKLKFKTWILMGGVGCGKSRIFCYIDSENSMV